MKDNEIRCPQCGASAHYLRRGEYGNTVKCCIVCDTVLNLPTVSNEAKPCSAHWKHEQLAQVLRTELQRIAEYEPFVAVGERVSWKRVAQSLQRIAREALKRPHRHPHPQSR